MCNISTKLNKKDYPKYIYKVVFKDNCEQLPLYYGLFSGASTISGQLELDKNTYYRRFDKFKISYNDTYCPIYNEIIKQFSLITGFGKLKDAKHLLKTENWIMSAIIRIKVDKNKVCFKGDANHIAGNSEFFGRHYSKVITYAIPKPTLNQIGEYDFKTNRYVQYSN